MRHLRIVPDDTKFGFMRFRRTAIDGMEFLLLRQGMAGEVGYELHGRWDEGAAVYQRLVDLGQKYGIRRLGGRTKMVNHVEACFPTPGVDYVPAWAGLPEAERDALRAHVPARSWDRVQRFSGNYARGDVRRLFFSPVELGWGRNIRFDHDFTGSDALRDEVDQPRRVMRTLVWNSDDVADVMTSLLRKDEEPYEVMELPRELLGNVRADTVLAAGREAGVATSRCYSYYFREMLSLAVLDVGHAEPGTPVEVLWGSEGSRQKIIRAAVAPAPYKTDRRRSDVSALPAPAL